MGSRAMRIVWLLTGLAFLLRASWAVRLEYELRGRGKEFLCTDSCVYDALADGLLRSGAYGLGPDDRAGWPPTFPCLLACIYALTGSSVLASRLVHSALGALLVPLGAVAAGRLGGGPRARVCAAMFLSLWPHGVAFSGLLMTETLASLLLVALLATLTHRQAPASGRSARAGLLAGALILTRPSFVCLPIVLALLWRQAERPGARPLALFLAIAWAFPLAWSVRNAAVLGAWPVLTSKLGHDLYEGIGSPADGGAVGRDVDWRSLGTWSTEAQRNSVFVRAALTDAARAPGRVLRLVPVKWKRLWAVRPNAPEVRTPAGILASAIPVFLWIPLALRALPGNPGAPYYLAPALYLAAVHAIFIASIRFRVPCEAPLAILAACGLFRGAPQASLAQAPP